MIDCLYFFRWYEFFPKRKVKLEGIESILLIIIISKESASLYLSFIIDCSESISKERYSWDNKKYGITLKDDEQTLDTWLNHIQEELMDALLYLEAAKYCLRDEIQYMADLMKKNKRKNDAQKD